MTGSSGASGRGRVVYRGSALKDLNEEVLEDICKKDEQAEESRRLLEETTESLRSQEKAVQEAQTKCRDPEKMGAVHEQVTQIQDAGELECLAWWPSWKHRLDQDRWNLERSLPQHPRAVQI